VSIWHLPRCDEGPGSFGGAERALGSLLGTVSRLDEEVRGHRCQVSVRTMLLSFTPDVISGCELTGDTTFTGQNIWKEAQGARVM
jgi:hypothetical protein